MMEESNCSENNVNVFQKDATCSIDKHERGQDAANHTGNRATERKGFSTEDIMVICTDVARSQNIKVVTGDNSGDHISVQKKESSLSQKLKSYLPRRSSNLSDSKEDEDVQHNTEAIPGLHGRDVVAVAILVGSDGTPIKSYTEDDEIPSVDMESAGNVILTRVPVDKVKESSANTLAENSDANTKSLVDILSNELDINDRKKLIKRMEKILTRLHTTDLNTARSFLKSERYANVRKSVKNELISFLTKDMKLVVKKDGR